MARKAGGPRADGCNRCNHPDPAFVAGWADGAWRASGNPDASIACSSIGLICRLVRSTGIPPGNQTSSGVGITATALRVRRPSSTPRLDMLRLRLLQIVTYHHPLSGSVIHSLVQLRGMSICPVCLPVCLSVCLWLSGSLALCQSFCCPSVCPLHVSHVSHESSVLSLRLWSP